MHSGLLAASRQDRIATLPESSRALQHGSHRSDVDLASSQVESLQDATPRTTSSGIDRESGEYASEPLSHAARNTPVKIAAQRISEYENALLPKPAKQEWEGPGFQIVKKKGHRLEAARLDEFPNGR